MVLAMLFSIAIPVCAQEEALPENLLTKEGFEFTVSGSNPSPNATFAMSKLTDTNRVASESRAIIFNIGNGSTSSPANGSVAWVQFAFGTATEINKITFWHYLTSDTVMARAMTHVAVDVLLPTGGWKRVAAEYDMSESDIAAAGGEVTIAFAAVNAKSVRISFNSENNANAVILSEVEIYNDTTITSDTYTGIDTDDGYGIAEALQDMNLLRGLTAATSNTKSQNVARLTDGLNNATQAYTEILNVTNTNYAWVEFTLPEAKPINKIFIQQRWMNETSSPLTKVADIAVDIRLATGGWKRVASIYNITAFYSGHNIYFAPETVAAVRITVNGARYETAKFCPTEIEAYYNSKIDSTLYTGVQTDETYQIPEVFSDMNLLRGIVATTSGGESDTGVDLITNSYKDRESSPALIHNTDGTDTAWVEFALPEAKPVNRVFLMQKYTTDGVTTDNKYADLSVEVKIDGKWQQVASSYGITSFYNGNEITFPAVTTDSIRVKAYGTRYDRNIFYVGEIEANYHSWLNTFTGFSEDKNLVNGTAVSYKNDDTNAANILDGDDETAATSLAVNGIAGFEVKFADNKYVLFNSITINSGVYSDIAVDVLTSNGWERAVAVYDNALNEFTFEKSFSAKAMRITANLNRGSEESLTVSDIGLYYRPESVTTEVGADGGEYNIAVAVKGDINLDFAADGNDLIIIRKELLGLEDGFGLTDVNCDNATDIRDLVALKKAIANI